MKLYQPTASEVKTFTRHARRIERMLSKKSSLVDPTFAIAKMQEVIASATDPFTVTDELTLQIPALPRPTLEELRKKYSWIREKDGIESDLSPTEAVTLRLATALTQSEERIVGPEYERRIEPARKQMIVLGYQQAVWLVEHQDAFPAFMALLGKIYIDFSGIVVVVVHGHRHFPGLGRGGTRWYLDWRWISGAFYRNARFAVSSK